MPKGRAQEKPPKGTRGTKGHQLRGTAIRPAGPRATRRLATERAFGEPIKVVVLFRAPPPVLMVTGRMWIDETCARKVTVVGFLGADRPRVIEALAVWRTNRWVAYFDDQNYQERAGVDHLTNCLLTTGPLDPREHDITWAWGWKSNGAKALKVMAALAA